MPIFHCDELAVRLKGAVELDQLGTVDPVMVTRFANALRLLDSASEMTLFDILRKTQRLQCIQDGVGLLRKEFYIVHR